MARLPLIAGNWKMHLSHLEAIALVQKLAFTLSEAELTTTEVVVFPPFTALRSVQTLVHGDRLLLRYGAQDLSPHGDGPYTGDVSGSMLAKLGCHYVIVGHSERRTVHAEGDDVVAAKLRAALAVGITPLLCVGEPTVVRDAGGHVEHGVEALTAALRGVPREQAASLVVAYEPIWAIGTGQVATPEHAQELCVELRRRLAELYDDELAAGVRLLYGGSVKAANIAGLMAQPDVDGALVGGAALVAEEFAAVCRWRTGGATG